MNGPPLDGSADFLPNTHLYGFQIGQFCHQLPCSYNTYRSKNLKIKQRTPLLSDDLITVYFWL